MQKAESKGERNNVKMRTRTKKFNTVLVVIFLLVCCMLILQSDECFAAPRTGNIEIDFKGRTDDIDDVLLSGAKFEIFPIQYMENGMMVWRSQREAGKTTVPICKRSQYNRNYPYDRQ